MSCDINLRNLSLREWYILEPSDIEERIDNLVKENRQRKHYLYDVTDKMESFWIGNFSLSTIGAISAMNLYEVISYIDNSLAEQIKRLSSSMYGADIQTGLAAASIGAACFCAYKVRMFNKYVRLLDEK